MLMKLKSELRKLYKSIRKSVTVSEKEQFDKMIFTHFINSNIYKRKNTVLIYVSFGSEADTFRIIDYALTDGKCVAVPYCFGNEMNFYLLNSLDDLVTGAFGIPTVNPDKCFAVNDFSDAICVLPGLSFDKSGNRLGYGGGYYDRFLNKNDVMTVGMCYERCVCHKLPCEEHDISTDYILTENGIANSKREVST